jgi:transcriptional regulator with XRE-family HTH domain
MRKYERHLIAEMQRIGASVRARRKRLKLSQTDVAAWIHVRPRRYGYFETGRARLTPQQIQEIEARLDAVEKGEEFLRHRPLNLVPERNFLSVQQKLLKGRKYSDFWLFGLRQLPVLRDSTYQSIWHENLKDGINYRLVWCLDEELSDVTIQLFQTTISQIVSSLPTAGKKKQGKVTIYGVCIGDPENEKLQTRTAGAQPSLLVKQSEQFRKLAGSPFSSFVTIKGPIVISRPEFERCRPVVHYGWLRSVVFYQGAEDLHSYAAVFLENVSNDPRASGHGDVGWTFLTPVATAALRVHIRAFADLVPA